MYENELNSLTIILPSILFLILIGANHFYQTRARRFADEILRDNPKEYNKQITANAYIYLFGRSFLGILYLFYCFYYVYDDVLEVTNFWTIVNFLIGIGFIVFGIWGFRQELKRKIEYI